MIKIVTTKKVHVSLIIIAAFAIMLLAETTFAQEKQNNLFSDVPQGHWAANYIYELRSLGITQGVGNNKFGIGMQVKRSEFAAFLARLMKWEIIYPENGSFIDNKDKTKWYYPYIETAVNNGAVSVEDNTYRPDSPITREEMAVMIVKALGYSDLAESISMNLTIPFIDISTNTGFISIAKDFGIIKGVGNNKFNPYGTATREQAAAMLIRMYENISASIQEIHSFYAIRSANQSYMINCSSAVSFGWSRLEFDPSRNKVILNTARMNNNEYAIPDGFEQPFFMARNNNIIANLMIFVNEDIVADSRTGQNIRLTEYIISNPDIRTEVIDLIISQINSTVYKGTEISFDGVTIDFENLRGVQYRNYLNSFIKHISDELKKYDKKLYVAVHPARKPGQAYYDAYDFRFIGDMADKVILMAHDYYARQLNDFEMNSGFTITPLTPIDEIYYALKYITDESTGVKDASKIMLQFSFDAVQWKLKDGKVINSKPYRPSYDAVQRRLIMEETEILYSQKYQNPYALFYDASDGTYNVLWYEDQRSIQAKINIAKMFAIRNISLWRLGNIPDFETKQGRDIYLDVWKQILSNTSTALLTK